MKYECTVCGFIYDEEKEGVKWADLPDDWLCPLCSSGKDYFKPVEEGAEAAAAPPSEAKPEPEPAAETPAEAGSKKIRCEVCGYITHEGNVGDVCPACGVPASAFKPFEDKMSAGRRKILDLHSHNIIVHFPQAFSVFMLFLLAAAYFLAEPLKSQFHTAFNVLAFFLPFSVLAAVVSGVTDGKVRFKRVSTPILKRKIGVGVVFLLGSVAVALIVLTCWLPTWFSGFPLLVLTGICALASMFLGYNGGRIAHAEMPG